MSVRLLHGGSTRDETDVAVVPAPPNDTDVLIAEVPKSYRVVLNVEPLR